MNSSGKLLQVEEYMKKKNEKTNRIYLSIIVLLVLGNAWVIVLIISKGVKVNSNSKKNFELLTQLESVKKNMTQVSDSIQKMQLKLTSRINSKKHRFTDIIKSTKEFDSIFSLVDNKKKYVTLCYQGNKNKVAKYVKYDYCIIPGQTLFLFQLSTGFRFGAYLEKGSLCSNEPDDKAFLFLVDKKKKFMVSDPTKAFSMTDEGFSFGGGDLTIKGKWMDEGSCFSDFPLNYGEKEKDKKLELTEGKTTPSINIFEIYNIYTIDK